MARTPRTGKAGLLRALHVTDAASSLLYVLCELYPQNVNVKASCKLLLEFERDLEALRDNVEADPARPMLVDVAEPADEA